MQTLNGKAKTAWEIEMMISSARNEYRKSKLDSTILAELKALQDEKWVRLEEAQQEIDEHGKNNEALAKVCSNLNEEIRRLQQEREEWKQKLQQAMKEFPCSKCTTWKDSRCTETCARSHQPYAKWFLKWIKKFEELLE
jgi:predicted nuclease with TOPRIM domain